MKVFIKAISYYLPELILTNEMLVREFPEWTVEKVASKIGISERHIAGKDETASDLAEKAAKKLFMETGINQKEIGFLMLCTQSPDYFLPTTACLLQEKLGIPTSCGAIDFNMGCSGFIYGLSLAKGLICAGITKNVLLLTAETYSKYIHEKDKGNRTIFGDAAAATLISTEGFAEILDFCLGSDGRGADNLIVKSGGFRHRGYAKDMHFDDEGTLISSDHLFMNGYEIFNFTLDAVPKVVANTLHINAITKDQISLFVFHQANKYIMDFLRKKIQIEETKFYYCLEKFGNTVSSTIPIALNEAKKENKLEGNILIAGFGVGYSWGATILKIKNEISNF